MRIATLVRMEGRQPSRGRRPAPDDPGPGLSGRPENPAHARRPVSVNHFPPLPDRHEQCTAGWVFSRRPHSACSVEESGMRAARSSRGHFGGHGRTMKSLAISPPDDNAYSIDLPGPARVALAAIPDGARAAILRRLAEISHVAGTLRTWMSDASDLRTTMYFELAGYAVSYCMSDARRMLQVMGVVPCSRPGERSLQ